MSLMSFLQGKRAIYSKRFKIAAGGRTPGNNERKRTDTDIEPVFHFSYPPEFYEARASNQPNPHDTTCKK